MYLFETTCKNIIKQLNESDADDFVSDKLDKDGIYGSTNVENDIGTLIQVILQQGVGTKIYDSANMHIKKFSNIHGLKKEAVYALNDEVNNVVTLKDARSFNSDTKNKMIRALQKILTDKKNYK